MKILKILLVWLALTSAALADGYGSSGFVLGDTIQITFDHTFAIDSAKFIVRYGRTVVDTISATPFSGTSSKHLLGVETDGLVNVGTHNFLIEIWQGGAVIDTPATGLFHNFSDSLSLRRFAIIKTSGSEPAFSVQNSGGSAVHFQTNSGVGAAGLYLQGAQATSNGLRLSGVGSDLSGVLNVANFNGTVGDMFAESTYTFTSGTNRLARVADSTAFQGAAANLPDSVTARIDSILASLGYESPTLHNKVDAIPTAGTGAYTVSIYVKAGSTYLQNASVRLATAASGGTSYYDNTDATGLATFSLGTGTYYGWASLTNYSQSVIPDIFVVNGANYNDTLVMTTLSVPGATAPNMCNVYIDTWAVTGDTVENATLEITVYDYRPPYRDSDSSVIIIPQKILAYTDSTGRATKAIVRSSEATDVKGSDIRYNFTLSKASEYFVAKFEGRTVPDSTSWKIR